MPPCVLFILSVTISLGSVRKRIESFLRGVLLHMAFVLACDIASRYRCMSIASLHDIYPFRPCNCLFFRGCKSDHCSFCTILFHCPRAFGIFIAPCVRHYCYIQSAKHSPQYLRYQGGFPNSFAHPVPLAMILTMASACDTYIFGQLRVSIFTSHLIPMSLWMATILPKWQQSLRNDTASNPRIGIHKFAMRPPCIPD